MLQEGHIWSQERQDRWQKTREMGCRNYVSRMAALALLGAVAVSVVYCVVALASGRDFHLSTALTIPVVGVLSGLIVGRAYWVLGESSFKEMNSWTAPR